ncbi:MAG: hypothetical protein ACI9G1_005672, partial [Pirellulaceae bacterium]
SPKDTSAVSRVTKHIALNTVAIRFEILIDHSTSH